jgi:lysophospholipase L1-like esterase
VFHPRPTPKSRAASWLLAVFLAALPGFTSAQESKLPTLWLIGDSTVRNGRSDGAGALWGWGDVLAPHFNTNKIRVVNRALGGRSSRSFLTEGLWDKVLVDMKPGDFVMMQFGHNDGGDRFKGTRPRASLRGNGDETEEGIVEQTGKAETVHTFGWYLRRYIADTKAKGASPIVCSLISRNDWKDGKVLRASASHGKWAAEAAKAGGAPFIDLNELIALRYEPLGQAKVTKDFFVSEHTHTSKAGAQFNAEVVAGAVRALADCKLKDWLATNPAR